MTCIFYNKIQRKSHKVKKSMNQTIHKCVCNAIAVLNPTQYTKFDKHFVKSQKLRWVRNCFEIRISRIFFARGPLLGEALASVVSEQGDEIHMASSSSSAAKTYFTMFPQQGQCRMYAQHNIELRANS